MDIILIILSVIFGLLFMLNFINKSKQNLINTISRIFVGIVFVFSGFVKAVDPVGSTIKFTDYFLAFGLNDFLSLVYPLALILSGLEFIIGISLLFNVKIKFGSLFALIFMLFFTPLTLYLAIKNPVTDCGCFGDALVITNWQTFWKNIVIILPAILIFINRKNIKSVLSNKNQSAVLIVSAVAITMFSVYCEQHLPVLDFRPYKIGNNISALQKEIFELNENIPEEKAILDKIPENERKDSIVTTFIYEKDGVQKEFSDIPDDTTWQWVETKNIIIKEGYHPPIHDFSITDFNGNDITEMVLADTSYSFLIISYKIDKADFNGIVDAAKLASKTPKYKFYFLTASLNDDIIKLKDTLESMVENNIINFTPTEQTSTKTTTIYYYEKDGEMMEFTEDEIPTDEGWEYVGEENIELETNTNNRLPFDFYTTDETTLKTIIRSNPGLVLIKKGTIINKWAYRDIPEKIDF